MVQDIGAIVILTKMQVIVIVIKKSFKIPPKRTGGMIVHHVGTLQHITGVLQS